jgi:hypothetical protein
MKRRGFFGALAYLAGGAAVAAAAPKVAEAAIVPPAPVAPAPLVEITKKALGPVYEYDDGATVGCSAPVSFNRRARDYLDDA